MCGKLPHVETLSNPDNYSLEVAVWDAEVTTIPGKYECNPRVNVVNILEK